MIRFACVLCWLLYFSAPPAEAATLEFPASLDQGTAVFLRVLDFVPGAKLTGSFNTTPFPITDDGLALIAVDMETPPGDRTLQVTLGNPNGRSETLTQQVVVNKRDYHEEHITLPEGRVSLSDKKDAERARRETEAIRAAFRVRDGLVGFQSGFSQPVQGRLSSVFGSRRILNGTPKSPHNGCDIAAPKGTQVHATAPGTVVLVGKNYILTGNTVVLHHGHGVISLYAHLDSVLVRKGDGVSQGQTVGRVGTTGRSTGPHLHWGTLVREQRVDPMRLPGVAKGEKIY